MIELDVRCMLCHNPNRSGSGCDGACDYNDTVVSAIDDIITEWEYLGMSSARAIWALSILRAELDLDEDEEACAALDYVTKYIKEEDRRWRNR